MNFSGFTLLSRCVTAAHCVQCPQLLYVVSQKDRGVRVSVCVCVCGECTDPRWTRTNIRDKSRRTREKERGVDDAQTQSRRG